MATFLEVLRSGRVLLMDGAMGTELIRAGLRIDQEPCERWNLTHADQVRRIHASYLDAGASCLVTNTFLAADRLADAEEQRDSYAAAIHLARSAGPQPHFVLGSFGPPAREGDYGNSSGWCGDPQRYLALMKNLEGADAILLETQHQAKFPSVLVSLLAELPPEARLRVPLIVSITLPKLGGRVVDTGHAAHPESIAHWLGKQRSIVAAVGVNCGLDMGMTEIIQIVRRFRQVTDLPILARPNAGSPVLLGAAQQHLETAARMAERLPELIDAGATMIGGCCGTTPAHIAAFRKVIDRRDVGWRS